MTARSARLLQMIELCPACRGNPYGTTYFCGNGGCDTLGDVCLFCDGAGSVPVGEWAWPEIGERIKSARYDGERWWGRDGDRLVWTLDESRREGGPTPLELEAKHHDIPAAMLDAIERGIHDPRAIAKTARRAPIDMKQGVLL